MSYNLEKRIERIEKALEMLGVKLPPLDTSTVGPNELAEIRRMIEEVKIENERLKRNQRKQIDPGSYYWETYKSK